MTYYLISSPASLIIESGDYQQYVVSAGCLRGRYAYRGRSVENKYRLADFAFDKLPTELLIDIFRHALQLLCLSGRSDTRMSPLENRGPRRTHTVDRHLYHGV
jgi:hypothetical protein